MPTPITANNFPLRQTVADQPRPEARESRSGQPAPERFADQAPAREQPPRQVDNAADVQPVRRQPSFNLDESVQRLIEQRFDRSSVDDARSDLSRNAQRALQAFANNAPSVEERLGIELVGIDTFA